MSGVLTPGGRGSKLCGSTETLLLSPSVISPADSTPYIYDLIIILWQRAWVEYRYAEATSQDKLMRTKTTPKRGASELHIPGFELSNPHPRPLFFFYAHTMSEVTRVLKDVMHAAPIRLQ